MDIYLGLGSNLGDKEKNLLQAIYLINSEIKCLRIVKVSNVYITSPIGNLNQPYFLNCAILCKYSKDNNYQYKNKNSKQFEQFQSPKSIKSSEHAEDNITGAAEDFAVTQANGLGKQTDTKNITEAIEVEDFASNLLYQLKNLERKIGRKDNPVHFAPREIDIDILLFVENENSKTIVNLPFLKVPHPELKFRKFVLRPLLDLNSAIIDPLTGESIKYILSALNRKQEQKSFQKINLYGSFTRELTEITHIYNNSDD